jgi:hypothetical protein
MVTVELLHDARLSGDAGAPDTVPLRANDRHCAKVHVSLLAETATVIGDPRAPAQPVRAAVRRDNACTERKIVRARRRATTGREPRYGCLANAASVKDHVSRAIAQLERRGSAGPHRCRIIIHEELRRSVARRCVILAPYPIVKRVEVEFPHACARHRSSDPEAKKARLHDSRKRAELLPVVHPFEQREILRERPISIFFFCGLEHKSGRVRHI